MAWIRNSKLIIEAMEQAFPFLVYTPTQCSWLMTWLK